MGSRYKSTGCAKFLLFLLIFIPLAYFGASYYHGVNGLAQIKDWAGIEQKTNQPEESSRSSDDTYSIDQQKEIDELKQKVKELESELYRKSRELEELKTQSSN